MSRTFLPIIFALSLLVSCLGMPWTTHNQGCCSTSSPSHWNRDMERKDPPAILQEVISGLINGRECRNILRDLHQADTPHFFFKSLLEKLNKLNMMSNQDLFHCGGPEARQKYYDSDSTEAQVKTRVKMMGLVLNEQARFLHTETEQGTTTSDNDAYVYYYWRDMFIAHCEELDLVEECDSIDKTFIEPPLYYKTMRYTLAKGGLLRLGKLAKMLSFAHFGFPWWWRHGHKGKRQSIYPRLTTGKWSSPQNDWDKFVERDYQQFEKESLDGKFFFEVPKGAVAVNTTKNPRDPSQWRDHVFTNSRVRSEQEAQEQLYALLQTDIEDEYFSEPEHRPRVWSWSRMNPSLKTDKIKWPKINSARGNIAAEFVASELYCGCRDFPNVNELVAFVASQLSMSTCAPTC